MTVFFTADHHFNHARIIKLCNRPFTSVDEMNDVMVERWNSVVGRNDTVYHLGDFTLYGEDIARCFLDRLKGNVHLIWGNHDRSAVRRMARWESSQYGAEINLDGNYVILCHYGMRAWNHSLHGALMLYGHSHGNLPGNNQSLDVGVDCWDFYPVTLTHIIARMETLPPFRSEDHHGADSGAT